MRPDCFYILDGERMDYQEFRKKMLSDPDLRQMVSEIPDNAAPRLESATAPSLGTGFEFVSPNDSDTDLTFEEATAQLAGQKQKDFRAFATDVDQFFDPAATGKNALGDWADGAEPTTVTAHRGDISYEDLRVSTALKSAFSRQKAGIPFKVDPDGEQFLYEFTIPGKTVKEARDIVAAAGIEFRTLVEQDGDVVVYVFDAPETTEAATELRNKIETLVTQNKYDYTYRQGRGEFLGSWTSREEGHAIFREVVGRGIESARLEGSDGRGDGDRASRLEDLATRAGLAGGTPAGAAGRATGEGSGSDVEVYQSPEGAGGSGIHFQDRGTPRGGFKPRSKAAASSGLRLTHWSNRDDLTDTDPAKYGTGGAGEERSRKKDYPKLWVNRTYAAYGKYRREAMIGGNRYTAMINPGALYDYEQDALDLYPSSADLRAAGFAPFDRAAGRSLYEKRIKEAGFAGYVVPSGNTVALFEKMSWAARPESDRPALESPVTLNEAAPRVSNKPSPRLIYNNQYGEPQYNNNRPRDPQSHLGSILGSLGYDRGGDAGAGSFEQFVVQESDGRGRIREKGVAAIKALEKWADKNEAILHPESFRRGVMSRKQLGDGSEHTVWADATTKRVVKLTHGDDVNDGVVGQSMTVAQYLENLLLGNEIFGLDTRVEGIVYLDNEFPQVVTSQPFYKGKNATEPEIIKFFTDQGFVKKDGGWVKTLEDGRTVDVRDAVSGNIIKVGKTLVPFDVQISGIKAVLESVETIAATPQEIQRFRELTKALTPTKEGIESFKQSNPEAYPNRGERGALIDLSNGSIVNSSDTGRPVMDEWQQNVDLNVMSFAHIENLAAVHTHPDESGLSDADVEQLAWGAKKVQAITPSGKTFTMSRPKSLTRLTPREIRDAWAEAENDIFSDARGVTMSVPEMVDSIGRSVASKLGLIYETDAAPLISLEAQSVGSAKLTQADIESFKQSNPEAYAELQGIRAAVLGRAGYDVGPWYHGTETDWTTYEDVGASTTGGFQTRLEVTGVTPIFLSDVFDVAESYGGTVKKLAVNLGPQNLRASIDNKGRSWGYAQAAVNAALNEGKHSVVIENTRDAVGPINDLPSKVAVVIYPEQIKSADPLALDDQGNLIGPEQWGDVGNPDIRFSEQSQLDAYFGKGQETPAEYVTDASTFLLDGRGMSSLSFGALKKAGYKWYAASFYPYTHHTGYTYIAVSKDGPRLTDPDLIDEHRGHERWDWKPLDSEGRFNSDVEKVEDKYAAHIQEAYDMGNPRASEESQVLTIPDPDLPDLVHPKEYHKLKMADLRLPGDDYVYKAIDLSKLLASMRERATNNKDKVYGKKFVVVVDGSATEFGTIAAVKKFLDSGFSDGTIARVYRNGNKQIVANFDEAVDDYQLRRRLDDQFAQQSAASGGSRFSEVTPDNAPYVLPDPAEVKARTKAGTVVGTRSPTAAGLGRLGEDPTLLIDLNAVKQDAKVYKKNALLLADYPILKGAAPRLTKAVRAANAPVTKASDVLTKKRGKLADLKEELQARLAKKAGLAKSKIKMGEVDSVVDAGVPEKWIASMVSKIQDARNDVEAATAALKEAKDVSKAALDAVVDSEWFTESMAEGVYKSLVEITTSNLEVLAKLFPEDIQMIAKLWYDGANIIAQKYAAQFDTTLNRSSAVLAVFSPQKDWFMNVALAERTMQIWKEQTDLANHKDGDKSHRWDRKMSDRYLMRAGEPKQKLDKEGNEVVDEEGNPVYEKSAVFLGVNEETGENEWGNWSAAQASEGIAKARIKLKELEGKTLWELEDEWKARFIRMYSETYLGGTYQVVSPDGQFMGLKRTEKGSAQIAGWGGYNTIEKAIAVLSATPENEMQVISEALGSMHKVRSFYNNIVDPQNQNGHVTMDTHAIAALLWLPLAGGSIEVTQNFGGARTAKSGILGVNGLYAAFAEAYRLAASELSVGGKTYLPREIQSITWEVVRMLFPAKWKSNKNNVNAVRSIWSLYEQGQLTIEQARAEVFRTATGRDLAEVNRGAMEDGQGVFFPDWHPNSRNSQNNSGYPQGTDDTGAIPEGGGSGRMGLGRGAGDRGNAGPSAGVVREPSERNQPRPVLESPLTEALEYARIEGPQEGKPYSVLPKIYSRDSSVYSSSLRQAKEGMPESIRRALNERVYLPDIRTEDVAAAEAFLDAQVGAGTDIELAAYLADTSLHGAKLTEPQKLIVKAVAARRLQNGWAEIDEMVAEGEATPGQILLMDHYLAASEPLIKEVADRLTNSAQILNTGNVLAKLFNPRAVVPIGYKFPITKKQVEVLSKDAAATAIVKGIAEAKADAAASTDKKVSPVLGKAAAVKADPKDAADVERLVTAMGAADQSVSEQIKAAVIAHEIKRARRQLEAKSGVSDKALLDQIFGDVRKMVAMQMERMLAEPGPANQPATATPEELASRFRDVWDRSVLAEDAFKRAADILSSQDPAAKAALEGAGAKFNVAEDTGARDLVRQMVDFKTEVFKSLAQQDLTRQKLEALVRAGVANNIDPTLARQLAKAISETYDAELKLSVERKLNALKASMTKVAEIVDRPISDKLIKASNLGALTEENVYNILAPRYNLPAWNEEMAFKLDAALQDVQRLPENSLQRDEAVAKIMFEIAIAHREAAKGLEKTSHLAEVLSTFWTAGVLSGPPTHIVNATASGVSVLLESMAQATGYFFAARRAGISTSEARAFFGDMGRAITQIFHRDGSMLDNKVGLEIRAAVTQGVSRFKSEKGDALMLAEQWKWKQSPQNLGEAWNNVLSLYKYVGRAMLAADAANATVANDAGLIMRSRFEAMQTGLTGQALQDHLDKVLDKTGAARERAVAQAKEEMARGDFEVQLPFGARSGPMNPKLMFARRVEQLIERELFDADDIQASRRFAEYSTYNSDAYGLIGMMADIMGQITNKIGVTKPLVPFPRTLSNIVNQMLNFSPYGFARAANFSLSGILSSRYHNQSKQGLEFLKYTHPTIDKFSPEYYAAMGRASVGTAGLVALLALAMKGLDDERETGEQSWFEVTATGPEDFAKRKQLQNSGTWQPSTIRIGSLRLRYTDWPALGLVLAAVGAYSDARRYNKIDEKSAGEQMILATLGISSAVMEKQMLSGLSDLFKVIGGGPEGVSSAKRLTSSYAGGFTNPQALRWVRSTFDSTPPEQSTTTGWLLSMTPMALGYNKPSLNILGKPIERMFFEPTTQRFVDVNDIIRPDPVLSPLSKAGVFLPVPRRTSITDPKTLKDRSMTSDEFYDYAQTYGETVGRIVTPQMAESLSRMPRETAQKWVDDVVRPAARDAAKTMILRKWLGN